MTYWAKPGQLSMHNGGRQNQKSESTTDQTREQDYSNYTDELELASTIQTKQDCWTIITKQMLNRPRTPSTVDQQRSTVLKPYHPLKDAQMVRINWNKFQEQSKLVYLKKLTIIENC